MTKAPSSNLHQVDYTALVLGFSSAALNYLGIAFDGGPPPEKNLALAKQNIDILSLLKAKTKGNLSKEEQHLTDEVLADLQLKFVEATKS